MINNEFVSLFQAHFENLVQFSAFDRGMYYAFPFFLCPYYGAAQTLKYSVGARL